MATDPIPEELWLECGECGKVFSTTKVPLPGEKEIVRCPQCDVPLLVQLPQKVWNKRH